MDETVISIDPGKEKCGFAIVSRKNGVELKKIVASSEAPSYLRKLMEEFKDRDIQKILIGDRTGSKDFIRNLAKNGLGDCIDLILKIDEHMSSMEGRRRYLIDHPAKGLARLLPISMRYPDQPYDDYVAVILAERYFALKDK